MSSAVLGDVATFINGGAWSQSEYSESGVPVVRVTDIKDYTVNTSNLLHLPVELKDKYQKHLIKANDLVVCTVGSHPSQPGSVVGRTASMPVRVEGALLNQNAVIIRASSKLDQTWLNFYSRTSKFHAYIKSCARGSASQVRMSIGLLKEMPIDFPEIEEQRRIGQLLKNYDDLIDNNSSRIENLESIARILYNIHFESSEKDDWGLLTLNDCLTIHRGISYKSSELSQSQGLPFINLKCIKEGGGFKKSGLKWFTGKYKDGHIVKNGDIVMAITEMTYKRSIIARVGRVPDLPKPHGVISMDLIKISPKPGISNNWLYSMLRWSRYGDVVKEYANGANVLHLLPDRVVEYKINVPPVIKQQEFEEIVSPIFYLIDNLQTKNEMLGIARGLMADKLLSGGI